MNDFQRVTGIVSGNRASRALTRFLSNDLGVTLDHEEKSLCEAERGLLRAMIELAVKDLRELKEMKEPETVQEQRILENKQRNARSARKWFKSRETCICSFEHCCLELELERGKVISLLYDYGLL